MLFFFFSIIIILCYNKVLRTNLLINNFNVSVIVMKDNTQTHQQNPANFV